MFPVSMAGQRDKLLNALGRIVPDVSSHDTLLPFLRGLGRDHRKFGTVAEHYPAVGASLIATLKHFNGPSWTEDLAQDWTEAYGVIAQVMTDAAAEDEARNPAVVGRDGGRSRAADDGGRGPAGRARRSAALPPRAVRRRGVRGQAPGMALLLDGERAAARRDHRLPRAGHRRRRGQLRPRAPASPSARGYGSAPRSGRCGWTWTRRATCCWPPGARASRRSRRSSNRPPAWTNRRGSTWYSARGPPPSLYDLAELEKMAAQWPWLTVTPVVSGEPGYRGETGTVADVVGRRVPPGRPRRLRMRLAGDDHGDGEPPEVAWHATEPYLRRGFWLECIMIARAVRH